MNTLHGPRRPVWDCRGCGLPYPCPTERRTLTAEFAQAHLTLLVYLAMHYEAAVDDSARVVDGPLPDDLHQRFFAWSPG